MQLTSDQLKNWFKKEVAKVKALTKDDLELNNSGQWPASIKLLVLTCLLFGLIYASHWLILNSYKEELESVKQQQELLYEEYKVFSFQTANLEAYQQQLVIMQEALEELLNFLPATSNIPPLLDSIQQEADKLKLELTSLVLKPEKTTNYYVELPFTLEAKGSYHQLAKYLAKLSSLDRILTLHDFNLRPEKSDPNQLKLSVEAQAYRRDKSLQGAK